MNGTIVASFLSCPKQTQPKQSEGDREQGEGDFAPKA